jgi:hypothetical protein
LIALTELLKLQNSRLEIKAGLFIYYTPREEKQKRQKEVEGMSSRHGI